MIKTLQSHEIFKMAKQNKPHPSISKVFAGEGADRLPTQILCLVIFAEIPEIWKLLAPIADTLSLTQADAVRDTQVCNRKGYK